MRQNSVQDAKNGILNLSTALDWLQITITKIPANKNRIFKAVESEKNSAYSYKLSLTDTKQLTGISGKSSGPLTKLLT